MGASPGFAELQIEASADAAWAERWQFVKDTNGDGLITISDAVGWLKWVFLHPVIGCC